jgi:acyl-CoA dehydrogenase
MKNVCLPSLLRNNSEAHHLSLGIPADALFHAQLGQGAQRWSKVPPIIDELKAQAKKLGLWNIFLSKTHYKEGAGFTNLEYGLIAEQLGKSRVASEVRFTNPS